MLVGGMLSFIALTRALDPPNNGLALTPPMGWCAWEQFHCDPVSDVSEANFIAQLDHLADDGWRDVGYQYVNVDDCWMTHERDANGRLVPDPVRFPHGIKYITDHAHSKGVKFGMYVATGTKTCAGYAGSYGHEHIDAQTFAEWGIDYLKVDGCGGVSGEQHIESWKKFAIELNNSGRAIVYSDEWSQDTGFANSWRIGTDITGSWSERLGWKGAIPVREAIEAIGRESKALQARARPGHWNDPDQLCVGMSPRHWLKPLTVPESRSQFVVWCIIAAPLLMSNDLRNIGPEFKEVLQNKEVIAISQDKLGKAGIRNTVAGSLEVWSRELSDGWAVSAYNKGETPGDIEILFSEFGQAGKKFNVRNLWEHKDLGAFTDKFEVTKIAAHDTIVFKLTPA